MGKKNVIMHAIKKNYKLCCMALLISLLLCGCIGDKKTENIQTDNQTEWSFSETQDREKCEWETACEDIKADIAAMESVVSVSVEPETYEQYMDENKITIACTVKKGTDVSHAEEELSNYVNITNYFPDYSIEVMESKWRENMLPDKENMSESIAEEDMPAYVRGAMPCFV